MSHLGIDIDLYFLLTVYPVVALFVVEITCRVAKIKSWVKLTTQAIVCVGFGVAYVTMIVSHWITSIVLIALAGALFYQARIAKVKPDQSIY